jgi:hemerythrin superfamily protein
MSDQQPDVVALLLKDHDEARALFTKVQTTSGETQREAFRELVLELVRHETAEQEVVYPQVRTEILGGDELTDTRRREEEEATQLLAELEKLEVGGAEFNKKFTKLRENVLAHANAEETEVFPRLAVMKDEDRLKAMARLLELAKKTAPTHPHPNVPGTAGAQMLAGPIAALVDHTRDIIHDAVQKVSG